MVEKKIKLDESDSKHNLIKSQVVNFTKQNEEN